MREWFPLTNYEFYAFVASGMLLIAAIDYSFTDEVLIGRTDWSVVQIIFWTVISYISGQIIAIAASGLIEHWFARTLFLDPNKVALGIEKMRWCEHTIAFLFAKREYAPLAPPMQQRIKAAVAQRCGVKEDEVTAALAFQVAFPAARQSEDTRARLDNFLNAYGFSRNISFTAGIAAICLAMKYHSAPTDEAFWLCLGAVVVAVCMYGRFIKYYAAYGHEVFRAYAHSS